MLANWPLPRTSRAAGHVERGRHLATSELLARWEGDEMPPSVQDLNRVAATRTLPEDPYGQDAGIIGKVIDIFRNIWDPGAPPVK